MCNSEHKLLTHLPKRTLSPSTGKDTVVVGNMTQVFNLACMECDSGILAGHTENVAPILYN